MTLLKDAHSTESIELDDGIVVEAEHIIRELNRAMTWTDYPGRRPCTATVETADFAKKGGECSMNEPTELTATRFLEQLVGLQSADPKHSDMRSFRGDDGELDIPDGPSPNSITVGD